METNWQEVSALILGASVIAAGFVFSTRSIVRQEIVKLNGTYLRRAEADLRYQQIQNHFDFIREQIRTIHHSKHQSAPPVNHEV